MKLLFRKHTKTTECNHLNNQQATMFLATKESDKQVENNPKEKTYEVVETEIKPAHIICPDCGGITIEGLDYCHKCGGELKPSD